MTFVCLVRSCGADARAGARWFLGWLDKMRFVFGLMFCRAEVSVAEICCRCWLSRISDVVFVRCGARRRVRSRPLGASDGLAARRYARAEGRGRCPQWGDVGGWL